MFHNEIKVEDTSKMPILALDAVQENDMAVLPAKEEFVGYDVFYRNMKPLIESINLNDLNGFRFFLLNGIN